MKKVILLFFVFTTSLVLFAENVSVPRVTYDKDITFVKAFTCYFNFASKTDHYNNPFYSADKTTFIIPEFENIKNKTSYVVKTSNDAMSSYSIYRLDFSEFDPSNYRDNKSTYEPFIIPGAQANLLVKLDGDHYNMVLSLMHHSEGDIDDASMVKGEKAQKAIRKRIAERDNACTNYTCGNWDKSISFGKIAGLKEAEIIDGVKLSKGTEEDFVIDLMMSSVIGELNGRFFHPEYYSSDDNYISYKSKMQTKCSNVFVGL